MTALSPSEKYSCPIVGTEGHRGTSRPGKQIAPPRRPAAIAAWMEGVSFAVPSPTAPLSMTLITVPANGLFPAVGSTLDTRLPTDPAHPPYRGRDPDESA